MKVLKNLFLMLVAGMCMSLISCKKDEPEDPSIFKNAHVVGMWSLCEEATYGKKSLEVYYRLASDGTAECFQDEGARKFLRTGSFSVNNNWLNIVYKNTRFFRKGSEGDCLEADVWHDENQRVEDRVLIDAIIGNDIRLKLNGHTFYLVKISSVPDTWKAEYSEPAKAVNASNIPAQWDLRARFTLDKASATYSYTILNSPSEEGLTLQKDGALGSCVFWANQVWDKENKAGRVLSDQKIIIYSFECSWELVNKKLTMRCPSYMLLSYNSAGDIISQERITPETPIEIEYEVYTFTDHWMVLYALRNNTYYSFHRATAVPTSAPMKASVSTAHNN